MATDNNQTSQILFNDYDTPWKDVVEHFFPGFMAFYFPDAHSQINLGLLFEFLAREATIS